MISIAMYALFASNQKALPEEEEPPSDARGLSVIGASASDNNSVYVIVNDWMLCCLHQFAVEWAALIGCDTPGEVLSDYSKLPDTEDATLLRRIKKGRFALAYAMYIIQARHHYRQLRLRDMVTHPTFRKHALFNMAYCVHFNSRSNPQLCETAFIEAAHWIGRQMQLGEQDRSPFTFRVLRQWTHRPTDDDDLYALAREALSRPDMSRECVDATLQRALVALEAWRTERDEPSLPRGTPTLAHASDKLHARIMLVQFARLVVDTHQPNKHSRLRRALYDTSAQALVTYLRHSCPCSQ
jgi:hypothetical protein